MRRIMVAFAALGLAATLSSPVQADPPARTVVWQCELEDGEVVDFVVVPEAARHGIERADSRAGEVFAERFGEDCRVL
jgi:hypothetical protein